MHPGSNPGAATKLDLALRRSAAQVLHACLAHPCLGLRLQGVYRMARAFDREPAESSSKVEQRAFDSSVAGSNPVFPQPVKLFEVVTAQALAVRIRRFQTQGNARWPHRSRASASHSTRDALHRRPAMKPRLGSNARCVSRRNCEALSEERQRRVAGRVMRFTARGDPLHGCGPTPLCLQNPPYPPFPKGSAQGRISDQIELSSR